MRTCTIVYWESNQSRDARFHDNVKLKVQQHIWVVPDYPSERLWCRCRCRYITLKQFQFDWRQSPKRSLQAIVNFSYKFRKPCVGKQCYHPLQRCRIIRAQWEASNSTGIPWRHQQQDIRTPARHIIAVNKMNVQAVTDCELPQARSRSA